MNQGQLVAPFPWFGGKRDIAAHVRRQFGGITNYVEPFFGSGAVLLGGPPVRTETVNDADGLLVNAWRAMRADLDRAERGELRCSGLGYTATGPRSGFWRWTTAQVVT